MNKELKKQTRNNELRKTADIQGKDFTGLWYMNIHNSITMQIVSHWVSDKGIVLWKSDGHDLYSTSDIEKHWFEILEQIIGEENMELIKQGGNTI
tara:strand:+ start:1124 stop:1408 length:285 start_codon:yes stop_codon:yes gene_type:complete